MNRLNILPASCIFLLSLLSCSLGKNEETARYRYDGRFYVVELTGTRANMVHDPITAIFGSTSLVKEELRLPRIRGEINGNEIPTSGDIPFSGSVRFEKDGRIKIDLYFDDKYAKRQVPYSWNGSYILVPLNQTP